MMRVSVVATLGLLVAFAGGCGTDSAPGGGIGPGPGPKADGEETPQEDTVDKEKTDESIYYSESFEEPLPDEIAFLHEVPELPDELVVEQPSSDADFIVGRLYELRDNGGYERLTIGLGFTTALPAAGEPVIQWSRTGMYLSAMHVSDDRCGHSCGVDGAPMIECLAPGIEADRGEPENVSDTKGGICSIISAAHGIVRLGLADTRWPGVVNGRYWDDSYIQTVWTATGRNRTSSGTKAAYEAAWNQRWYAWQSYGVTSPSAGSVWDFTLKQWCEALGEYAHANRRADSCHLGLFSARSGHDMLVLSSTWNEDNEECEISTINSGIQGSPYGVNVPLSPGHQQWRVSGDRPWTDLKVCIAGDCADRPADRRGFWGRLGYNRVDFACYDEEPRWYWSEQPPDEKGSIWP